MSTRFAAALGTSILSAIFGTLALAAESTPAGISAAAFALTAAALLTLELLED